MIKTTEIIYCTRGLIEELVNLHHLGDFKFHREAGCWYVWNGLRWAEDRHGSEVCKMLGETLRRFLEEGSASDDEIGKFATQLFESPKKALGHVATMIAIECHGPVFDQSPSLLNTTSATVDLKTDNSRRHDRRDMLTKIGSTTHDPTAHCAEFLRFLDVTFGGDQELIAYVQRVLGYALTGETGEQLMWIWYGPRGQNGKSTLANIIRGVLGSGYTMDADAATVTGTERTIPSDVARLRDIRCLFVREPKRGAKLNASRVKSLTGDDQIVARFLRQEFFEFRPRFKLHMVTNHLPPVSENDEALWRRIRVLPFNVRIDDNAKRMDLDKSILANEEPGVLNWLVEGARLWYQHGLPACKAVEKASAEYKRKPSPRDALPLDHTSGQDFIDECLAKSGGGSLAKCHVYERYSEDCKDASRVPVSAKHFGTSMARNGFEHPSVANYRIKQSKSYVRAWYGVAFK